MRNQRRGSTAYFFLPADVRCGACWKPHVDIYRTPESWLVKFDLAGVSPNDVHVGLSGRRLTVRGHRRDWVIHEGHEAYSLEIAYNSFERSIELPLDLEDLEIRTQFQDGMFLIYLLVKERHHDRQ